jgi:hypothetical protein
MGWFSRLLGLERAPTPRLARIEWREGSYPTPAVGESNYQAALEAICGGYSRHGHEFECEAELVPEPDNAYDENAVKVLIGRQLVGYLCREDAVRFHEEMKLAGRPWEGARCAANIKGGWRTNQYDEGSFGVYLGIPGRGRFNLE